MASRRCLHAVVRHGSNLLSSGSISLHHLTAASRSHFHLLRSLSLSLEESSFKSPFLSYRSFTSRTRDPRNHFPSDQEDGEGEGTASEEEDEEDEGGKDVGNISSSVPGRALSPEDEIEEAAHIGYKVVGPLQPSENVFKPFEPVFAVVQIGSHQFKVSNGDCIYTERLKYCDVNDKLILNKVMLLGSQTQTIIGRPILPEAAVHAVVEEHALDAKVLIFKKKRRKNYRRANGHRQELTRLRITDIQGIEKPEMPPPAKKDKKKVTSTKKAEKVAVAA